MISMKLHIVTLFYLLVGVFISGCQESRFESPTQPFCLVIHGGAGTILKENMTPELEEEYIGKIKESLQAGYDILKKQGTSLDAVQEAITILEDSPLFNAGKGAVFTNIGTNELDASIMDGKSLDAGKQYNRCTGFFIQVEVTQVRTQCTQGICHFKTVSAGGKGFGIGQVLCGEGNIQVMDHCCHLNGGGNILNDLIYGFGGDRQLSDVHFIQVDFQVFGRTWTTGRNKNDGGQQDQ